MTEETDLHVWPAELFTNLVLTYSIFQNSTIPKLTSREFQDFKNSANSFHPSISLERDGQ